MTSIAGFFDMKRAGRVCFMGLGNPDYGDDGFGVRLAEELLKAGVRDVIVAGTTPERHLAAIAEGDFDDLVFLDAVECGAEAGSVVVADSREIEARFPQISTHKISVAVLAEVIESNGKTRVWLLGVQPQSLQSGQWLSPAVQRTIKLLKQLLLQGGPQPARDSAKLAPNAGARTC